MLKSYATAALLGVPVGKFNRNRQAEKERENE